jgi:Concanavalin A-like lectin/glucanases superfamily
MAIQWADDFSRYGTGEASRVAMLDGLPYAALGATDAGECVTDPDPLATGSQRAYELGYNGNNPFADCRLALPTVVTGTIGVVVRSWLAALPSGGAERPLVIVIQNDEGNSIVYSRVESNGSITVSGRVGGNVVQIADSVNPIIAPNSWNHWEMVHNIATGEGSVYINGIQRLTYTGVDTDRDAELVNFSGRSGTGTSPAAYIKDLVIWDDTGTVNNDVMGTVVVRRLKPNGDVSLGGWVPSTGTTGFNLLAKNAPADSSYLSADDTPPAEMIFDFEELPEDITSIRGILPVVRHRKTDGGDANVQVAISPNGTDWDNGADRAITTSFQYDFDVSELSPDTGLLWTPPEVDSIKGRVDRTL